MASNELTIGTSTNWRPRCGTDESNTTTHNIPSSIDPSSIVPRKENNAFFIASLHNVAQSQSKTCWLTCNVWTKDLRVVVLVDINVGIIFDVVFTANYAS